MAAFADPDDVAEVWQPLTPEQVLVAKALLEQASLKLRLAARRRGRDMDAMVTADDLTAQAARVAVVNAVKRVLMNPEALRQISETTGPFSTSKTIDSSLSSGELYIESADLADLLPGRSPVRSFRVRSRML
ncbi:Gp19/Gp15/Gp42 family protein [Leifsonia sp. F6_8S_P_1B]|uniref:Gp19/Gp15/Gp42 family protein n=1 Tax=Leifsonia williamsii TaxID=3035919 RepID=A0ABT8KG55_9MICO|nr:Gp19/Gp15/Gp42 family protein [Leifsonia williamsii]MDN4616413.1 Gp19/Gp15/Gp42 family protein [Leifsonia williamsii]